MLLVEADTDSDVSDSPGADDAGQGQHRSSPKRVGRSGRKRKDPNAVPVDAEYGEAEYGTHGCSWSKYCEILREHSEVLRRMSKEERSKYAQETSAKLTNDKKIHISARTFMRRADDENDAPPRKVGGQIIPPSLEQKFVKAVMYYRVLKLPVFREDVINICEATIECTALQHKFPNGVSMAGTIIS